MTSLFRKLIRQKVEGDFLTKIGNTKVIKGKIDMFDS